MSAASIENIVIAANTAKDRGNDKIDAFYDDLASSMKHLVESAGR